jgi:hypothetical protein
MSISMSFSLSAFSLQNKSRSLLLKFVLFSAVNTSSTVVLEIAWYRTSASGLSPSCRV